MIGLTLRISPAAISRKVAAITSKYLETDPFRLAEAMGILTALAPMGLEDGCCKGFFITHCRIRHITVNADLPRDLRRIVMAHELGHAVLHASTPVPVAYSDAFLYDMKDAAEYQANIFAAELLLPDDIVMDKLSESDDFFDAAAALSVPSELLYFKLRTMETRGLRLSCPITARGNFLKELEKHLPRTEAGLYNDTDIFLQEV